MRAVMGSLALPANQVMKIFSVPVSDLHNATVKSQGSLYIGGSDLEVGKGIDMANGDVSAWTWQDFRSGDKAEIFDLYAVSTVETTISFLVWRR